jgi:hypothetical protein
MFLYTPTTNCSSEDLFQSAEICIWYNVAFFIVAPDVEFLNMALTKLYATILWYSLVGKSSA